jgi:hypothetical protein
MNSDNAQLNDEQIEALYRRYNFNKEQLEILAEPQITSYLRLTPPSHSKLNNSDNSILRKIQAEIEVYIVDKFFKIMTQEEAEFIRLRFFQDVDYKIISGCMQFSERKIYNIRDSVLQKSRKILSFAI